MTEGPQGSSSKEQLSIFHRIEYSHELGFGPGSPHCKSVKVKAPKGSIRAALYSLAYRRVHNVLVSADTWSGLWLQEDRPFPFLFDGLIDTNLGIQCRALRTMSTPYYISTAHSA